jgi:hypothetical protein
VAVDKNAIDSAVAGHAQWKARLTDAIEKGQSDFQVATVRRDNACAFGQWLYGVPASVRDSEDGKKVRALHAEFHELAAVILDNALKGEKQQALKMMELGGCYSMTSGKLVIALKEWASKP